MLEVTETDISALSDADLRELIGRLCEAELKDRKYSTSYVTYGGHQDASDGGLDVHVQLPPDCMINGYIPRPVAGVQAKATEMQPAEIKAEMRPKGNLRPAIMDLANSAGSYIIACSKESTTHRMLGNRKKAMNEALSHLPGGDKLHIDFYDQKRIASWVMSHSSLVPWVREKVGRPIQGWSSYGNWSHAPSGAPSEYITDDHARFRARTGSTDKDIGVREGIAKIRETLSRSRGVIRLIGHSGVGKTRLVQALFDEAVGTDALPGSEALYTDPSHNPSPAPEEMLRQLLLNHDRVILIVDNCPPDMHARLSQILLASSEKVALLTVEYDVQDGDPEDTEVFELRAASASLIEDLLLRRFAALSQVNAHSIAHFAGGNARIAIALAKSVGNRKSIAQLSELDLFQRLFKQRNDPDNSLLEATKVCSLLYSFDGEDTLPTSELSLLGSLTVKSAEEMYRHVTELIRRDLIQRRSKWRAILPHALANRMASVALEDIPSQRLEEFFLEIASPRMLRSFSRRLSYLHTSNTALRIAERWLSPSGMLADITNLTDLGCDILRNVAPVAPDAALVAIERGISSLDSTDSLLHSQTYAGILRLIAYDANLFERCVMNMAHLAQPLNEHTGWNEEGKMLISLFKPCLSGTHATIEQRLRVIERLLSAEVPNSGLVIQALKAALETGYFTSHYGFDFGARERDFGFSPSQTEVIHWFASTLGLCESLLAKGDPLASQIKNLVADELRGLWTRGNIYDEIVMFCSRRASEGFWAEGWRAVQTTLYFDGEHMPAEMRLRLEAIGQGLAPRDLTQQVRGVAFSENYDLYADGQYFREGRDLSSQIARLDGLAQSLGLALASDRKSFEQLLPEIVQARGRIWPLACGLAEGATNPVELWEKLIGQFCKTEEALRQTTSLNAFLSCLSRIRPQITSGLLDEAVSDPTLGRHFPGLQASVSTDPHRFKRLLQSLTLSLADADAFRNLGYAGAGDKFTASEFKELVLRIADRSKGFEVAIDILSMRLTHGALRGQDSESEVLNAGRALLTRPEAARASRRADWELGQIISCCIVEESDAVIARQLSRRLLDSMSSYQASFHDHDNVMSALFRVQPIAVLDEFAATVKKNSTRGIWVLNQIEGLAITAMNALSEEALLSWCDQEPQLRYPIAAIAIPFFTNVPQGQEPEWTPVAIRLLRKAPDPQSVLRQFVQRSQPSGFIGSIVESLHRTKRLLDQLAKLFPQKRMLKCIEEEKSRLDQGISGYQEMQFPQIETGFE